MALEGIGVTARDRARERREFLRLDPPDRLRRIDGGLDDIRERIDACAWMLEWAVPHEDPSRQAQLVELQAQLGGLKRSLQGLQAFWTDGNLPG